MQVDQDDFKTILKKFAEWIKEIDEELESQVKFSQAKAVELFKSACLQSSMVFGLDNKPILGVDASSNTLLAVAIRVFSTSIALNPLVCLSANKQKYKQASNADLNQASNNFILLANSLKESTAVLAQALLT